MSGSDAPRDRRRVRHPAPPGARDVAHLGLGRAPHAIVIGAGVAGLTAATALAERGVRVTVLERETQLGGRVASWEHALGDGTPVCASRGFHAFFRQYYNLRALLRRADPQLRRLVPIPDYPLRDEQGRIDTFRGLPRTPPWNALAFALRSPTFRARDLLALRARAAAPMLAVRVPQIYHRLDHVDAAGFLRAINFPPAARHLALEVFSRSFFAPPETLSAAELAAMFHLYFLGSSEGLLFDVPDDDYATALWNPLREYLGQYGVQWHLGRGATRIEPITDDTHAVPPTFAAPLRVHDTTGESHDADAVVLATDVAGLRAVVAASPALGDPAWRRAIDELATAPPFLVHRLWLDRPAAADRPAFLATSGLPPLDNVTLLDRYERGAAEWARRHHGAVVELHAYALSGAAGPDAVTARLVERLHGLYPETRGARPLGRLTLLRADCPLFAVNSHARRPPVRTPHPNVTLAGDAIRTDLPVALMERAATTGWQAANHLLAGWNVAGHPLETVPNHGRIPLIHRLTHT